jgi:hypothetical protein
MWACTLQDSWAGTLALSPDTITITTPPAPRDGRLERLEAAVGGVAGCWLQAVPSHNCSGDLDSTSHDGGGVSDPAIAARRHPATSDGYAAVRRRRTSIRVWLVRGCAVSMSRNSCLWLFLHEPASHARWACVITAISSDRFALSASHSLLQRCRWTWNPHNPSSAPYARAPWWSLPESAQMRVQLSHGDHDSRVRVI